MTGIHSKKNHQAGWRGLIRFAIANIPTDPMGERKINQNGQVVCCRTMA